MMKLHDSLITDRGVVRDHNEDAIGQIREIGFYVLADGMGGAQAGEVASQTLVTTMLDDVEAAVKPLGPGKNMGDVQALAILTSAMDKANLAIFEMSQKDRAKRGMGTTAVSLLLRNRKAYMAYVGDSRIYLLRDRKLHQLTEDHTRVNEMLKMGVISKEQAQFHPQRHVITRAIGAQPRVQIDTLVKDVKAGDLLMLCSDGLSNKIDHEELELRLAQTQSEEEKARRLVEIAKDNGGEDNISVILVRCGDVGAGEEPELPGAQMTTEEIKAISIFDGIEPVVVDEMVKVSETKTYKAGETVFAEGDAGGALYVIVEGAAKVIKTLDVERGIRRELAELSAGDFFGEISLIDKKPRSAAVIASQDSKMLCMSGEVFNGLIQSSPATAVSLLYGIMRSMSRRMRRMNEEFVKVFKARGKSAKELHELEEILSIVYSRVLNDPDAMPDL